MSAPRRIIETDGLGSPLMARVCAWCSKDLGAVVCAPSEAGKTSHGICDACAVLLRIEAEEFGRLRIQQVPCSEATAAQAVSTLPGTERPLQVKGTTAPDAVAPAALEHLSGGPAASFTFNAGRHA